MIRKYVFLPFTNSMLSSFKRSCYCFLFFYVYTYLWLFFFGLTNENVNRNPHKSLVLPIFSTNSNNIVLHERWKTLGKQTELKSFSIEYLLLFDFWKRFVFCITVRFVCWFQFLRIFTFSVQCVSAWKIRYWFRYASVSNKQHNERLRHSYKSMCSHKRCVYFTVLLTVPVDLFLMFSLWLFFLERFPFQSFRLDFLTDSIAGDASLTSQCCTRSELIFRTGFHIFKHPMFVFFLLLSTQWRSTFSPLIELKFA